MLSKRFLIVSILAAAALMPLKAEAGRYPWYNWIFTPPWAHYQRPLLEDATTQHFSQFENDPWTPEIWTQDRGSKEEVMKGFYKAGIIHDVDYDEEDHDDDAVMKVGSNFMRLSDHEKIHVLRYIDYVYGVTQSGNAIEIVYNNGDWFGFSGGDAVGAYTKNGLQLQ